MSFTILLVSSAQNPYLCGNFEAYLSIGSSIVIFNLDTMYGPSATFRIMGQDNLWELHQNAGQIIRIGNSQTTLGVGGSIKATKISDAIEIVCPDPNSLEFRAYILNGSPTIV